MKTHLLRFYRDVLDADARVDLPGGCNRVLYMESGSARVRGAGHAAGLGANTAWHSADACSLFAGPSGAQVHRWELLARDAAPDGGSALVMEAAISLDAAADYLMRCDRVDFPPGGIAYTHTHRGPGIRCLIAGSIRVDVEGKSHDLKPGEPWFEAGPEPVLATASTTEPSCFSRVMILPVELLGRSSIRYVLPEDQDKPKRQSYQLFVDEPVRI